MPRSSTPTASRSRKPAQERPPATALARQAQAGLDRRQEQIDHPIVRYIADAMPRIQKLLPPGVNQERFGSLVIQSLIANPDILACRPESIIQAVLEAAQDGLEPTGARGGAWLVRFGNDAQLIRDYRGVIRLIVGSGAATRVDAQDVREGETFRFRPHLPDPIEHEIPAQRSDTIVGAYALFWLPDGTKKGEYMTAAEIERTRQKSRGKDSLMWTDFWGQGARKTVIKRGANYLDLRPEIRAKLVAEDEVEFGDGPPITVTPVAQHGDLRDRAAQRAQLLTGGNAQPAQEEEGPVPASAPQAPPEPATAAEAAPAAPTPEPQPTLEEATMAVYSAAAARGITRDLDEMDAWERIDQIAREAIPETHPDELSVADWLAIRDRLHAGEFDQPAARPRGAA